MADNSLDKSLQAYRIMNTPTQYSWKQHWAQEEFDEDDMLLLDERDRAQFSKRLKECEISIMPSITSKEGKTGTLYDLVNTIIDLSNKNVTKSNRKVVYSTNDGIRPIGDEGWMKWNGFQVIDMDIKNEEIAKKLKVHIFNRLRKCNWFVGVTLSASGQGLHVYTKISIPESDEADLKKKKILYLTNFRHKYSFVYIASLSASTELGFTKDDLLKWMDMMMSKPQQGVFIGYDSHPLINTKFFEDFIYVNFDNIEHLGHPDIDWVSHPDLKLVFARWEWFDEEPQTLEVNVLEKPDLEFDTKNKVHYKHFERWRLANTLVKLYGQEKGCRYLRMICANSIRDKELQADCQTAARHDKPVDVWAVNRLNEMHGFKIKLNVQDSAFDESQIFSSMDKITNPVLIKESDYLKTYHLTKDQYLGNIRWQLLDDIGRITLLEAGAGVGKTEMVKQLVNEGKKIIMVMPFTSTIKAKVEKDKNWHYSYGSRQPRLDVAAGLSVTVDKFSRMNLMDIKTAGFDYIFIDESHLLFMSEYRPVMAKVIEMIRNTEVPIILMSGTPSGELIFFQDIKHLKVVKDDVRKKEFQVTLVDSTQHLMCQMCKAMARDIKDGKRILFPTNSGTLYAEQIKAGITYFLQVDHCIDDPVNLRYYKKSNIGEEFMDSVNFDKTISDTQVLLCTTYLSVGVDILDRYNFSIYFADLFMPQEVEQWANRLRSNDLYIKLFVAKNDAEGNSRSLHKFKPMNLTVNEDEIRDVHSVLRICNDMIERNPIEYKYNSLVSSIIHDNKYIEHNKVDNKYYLNEIAYKTIYFERKYREYVQQLPVLMKGMQAYGYEVYSKDLGELIIEGHEVFRDLKTLMQNAYDERVKVNTQHVEELMELINENNLPQYREVLNGKFEIRKGNEWKVDLTKMTMTVKNIEMFEKVVPFFLSFSKHYETPEICKIFEYCRKPGGSFNFAAIKRIRTLVNMVHNDKNERLDLPIKEFMEETYDFIETGHCTKNELQQYLRSWTTRYLSNASTVEILINKSILTTKSIYEKFEMLFKCLVSVSRPNKQGVINLEKIELLWQEREDNSPSKQIEKLFALDDFLYGLKIKEDSEDSTEDSEVF